jgi:hypothetical protein
MTKKELLKMIEDEVASAVRKPLREPEIKKEAPKPINNSPALTEEEIDDMLFYTNKKDKYNL